MSAVRIPNGLELDFTLGAPDVSALFLMQDPDGSVTGVSTVAVSKISGAGNVSEATSSVLTITGGTGAVLNSGLTIQVKQASGGQAGYLSSSDWTTFNNKLSGSLASANIFVGNGGGVATAVSVTGDISISNAGVTAIASGVIVNADINASAAIALSKLAALSASLVTATNGSGFITTVAGFTPTIAGFLVNVTSDIQIQVDSKLTVVLTAPASGDVITFDGADWVNSPSSGTGIPSGGTTSQVLHKDSNTNFDVSWYSLLLADISDVSASAAEVNKLSGLTATTVQLNYVTGVTSPIQSQINNKLTNSLNQNHLFVGDASNIPAQLAPGTSGYVLTSVSGTPTWAPASGGGGGIAGPGTSTDMAVVRWDGVLGTVVSDSVVIIDDTGIVTGATWNGNLIDLAYGGTHADLSATGGAGKYLKQASLGADITVASITAAEITSGAALTKVNDTNVTLTLGGSPTTALLAATSLTLGWTGLLAVDKGGTHADLSATGGAGKYLKQASSGADITVASITAAEITAGAALTKADDTNVTLTLGGTPSSALLAASSLTLGWTGTLAYARFVNGAGLSVVGRATNSGGVQADIAAANDKEILRRSGTSIGFGSIDLASSAVVGSTILPVANGGTNIASYTVGAILYASTSGVISQLADVAVGSVILSGGVTTAPAYGAVSNGLTATASTLKLGGVLTGATNITSNTANWMIFDGTWTGTASAQFGQQFNSTITGRASNADVYYGSYFSPTMTAGAISQKLNGVFIKPTFATGGFATVFTSVLSLSSSGNLSSDILLTGYRSDGVTAVLTINAAGTFNIGGGMLMNPATGGSASSTGTGLLLAPVIGASNSIGVSIQGPTTSSGGTDKQVLAVGNATYNPSSGTGSVNLIQITPTWSITGTSVQVASAVWYNPTETNMVGTTHYSFRSSSVTALGGVGIAAANPTAFWHIGPGTTTIAPFKLTSGTNLTSPVNGVMEYDGTNLYFTPSATTRQTVAYISTAQSFTGKQSFNQTTTTAPLRTIGFAGDPSVPVEGDVAYNTTTHLLKFYDGTSWVSTGAGAGSGWSTSSSTTITGNTSQSGAFNNTFSLNGILITQNVMSSAWVPALKITPGAHTSLTSTVEFPDITVEGAAHSWAAGTVQSQRFVWIKSQTVNGASAVMTNAYGFYVEKPTVGTGAITNNYALGTLGDIKMIGDAFWMGDNSLAGADRYINALGSAADVGYFISAKGAGSIKMYAGNYSFGSLTPSFGSGTGVIFINNVTVAPPSNPTGGGLLYVEGGALKFLGSAGSRTTIAAA